MNLAQIDSNTSSLLQKRVECIAFFVFEGNCFWIIDWEAHFNLDQKKNYDALLKHGHMTNVEYQEAISEFRGGLPTLTANLFTQYRDGQSAKVVTTEALYKEFFCEDAGQYVDLSKAMEKELSFNTPMCEEFIQLRCRLFSKLPKFYINYDRKIFMHMVRERSYDAVVLDGWWGAECDFEHMIPASQRYWARNLSEDYWAVTNFSNC